LKRADPGVEIVWKAFELRPEPVPTLDPAGGYLTRVWQGSVYPLAERLGVTMRLPPVQPRSRRAHEAAHWARTLGRFDDYNASVFRAFFERGEDISRVDVLLRQAADLRLDSSNLRAALERREFEASVLADEREAAELGVSGVPAFVADRRLTLSGVQSPEGLRELVERARTLRG
jgi:predicted DsbA family dithiol-disulfide isomerase